MLPSGLSFYENILPENLRQDMHQYFYEMEESEEFQPVGATRSHQNLTRRVIQYGHSYEYKIHATTPLPNQVPPLLREVISHIPNRNHVNFNQCIVNRYLEGEGIEPHIDADCLGDTIACFSFGAQSPIVFSNPETNEGVEILMKDNSFYLMEGDARYKWKHSMPNLHPPRRQEDIPRYSVTFRSI